MRFVVSVWHEFAEDREFEDTIPLEFNGRQLAALGEKNRIDVLVLAGYERFSDRYLGRLREFGYRLHDGEALARECVTRIPLLVRHYRNWGGIKHFGFLRFLVLPRFFPGEDIVTLDADIVFNAGFDEIERAIGGRLYFLGQSPCFGSIPARSGFFEIFEEHALRARVDCLHEVRRTLRLPKSRRFDPSRATTSDQDLLRQLQSTGAIDFQSEPLLEGNLLGFYNWLSIHTLGLGPYVYERRKGLDYINDRKLLVSHIQHDAWIYFWQAMLLARLFGRENVPKFGRIPILYPHYKQGPVNEPLRAFLARCHEAFAKGRSALPAGANPFCRGAVVKHYYEDSDLREILNDRSWHSAGVFADHAPD